MAELKVDQIGAKGDGRADWQETRIYVPFTLPGETVLADGQPPHMTLTSLVEQSAERIPAICRHFGTCGGCALQHWQMRPYLAWKRERVAQAMAREGLKVSPDPCVAVNPGSRRRVTLTARRDNDGKLDLGYHQRASHDLVDIAQCPIAQASIEAAFDDVRCLAGRITSGDSASQFTLTACDNGLDLHVSREKPLDENTTKSVIAAFADTRFLRLTVNGETIAEKEKPLVRFGRAVVAVPPGGFLQAVRETENAMADLVCDHLQPCGHVADLFCGSGTFSLRLAEASKILAVESDPAALDALAGANNTQGFKPVTTLKRDLYRSPLLRAELQTVDGLCLDPPRAGAEAQVREIAGSSVTHLAYVSCNPETFARDAAILTDAGYRLQKVVPFDQFLFSHHIELVGLFSKPAVKKKKSIFSRR